jgi:Fic family protein
MKLPAAPPDPLRFVSELNPNDFLQLMRRTADVGPELDGTYLHWDDLRRRPPPAGLSLEEWWFLVQTKRASLQKPLPLRDTSGQAFAVANPDSVQRQLLAIDQDAAGRIELPEQLIDEPMRDRYVMSSLMEEAITSSQLEGASTTRQVAKEMLRSGRQPRTDGERMIVNNFWAMEWIRAQRGEPLTPPGILELHALVTQDTLAGNAAGRLRLADERIHVVDNDSGDVDHVPPPAAELPRRLEALCAFAGGAPEEVFIHPVVRAILVHFWLAYDHPFVDGNGRTARALFYWQMLRQGYWLTEFLSISNVIKQAPSQYARAFLHTEVGNDTTFFVLHQLRVLRQAIDQLFAYVKRKAGELHRSERLLGDHADLNQRQLDLITHALRHPTARYTIQQHQRDHRVVYQTARTDLLDLVRRGWFEQRRQGKAFVFFPVPELDQRLRAPPRRATRRRKG